LSPQKRSGEESLRGYTGAAQKSLQTEGEGGQKEVKDWTAIQDFYFRRRLAKADEGVSDGGERGFQEQFKREDFGCRKESSSRTLLVFVV